MDVPTNGRMRDSPAVSARLVHGFPSHGRNDEARAGVSAGTGLE